MSEFHLQSCHHQVLCVPELSAVLAGLVGTQACLRAFPTALKELFPGIPSVDVDLSDDSDSAERNKCL